MEPYYFVEKNGVKNGPFKLQELKILGIRSNDLIWRSDNEKWSNASEFIELNGIYHSESPLKIDELTKAPSFKKTIYFSQQLLRSIIVGFLTSIFLINLIHVMVGGWSVEFKNGVFLACGYKCIYGVFHYVTCFDYNSITYQGPTSGEYFMDGFYHLSIIAITGLILSTLLYLKSRIKFKVIKE